MIQEYSKQHWINSTERVESWDETWIDENGEEHVEHYETMLPVFPPDERSQQANILQGREWRKYICKHWLANDLLDKLEDASDPTALMAFVDILTLLNYGMAQTAYNLLSSTAVPSELDELKTWLLDALNTIAQD